MKTSWFICLLSALVLPAGFSAAAAQRLPKKMFTRPHIEIPSPKIPKASAVRGAVQRAAALPKGAGSAILPVPTAAVPKAQMLPPPAPFTALPARQLEKAMELSVLSIQETIPEVYGFDPFQATAFVIEENFGGQTRLWGVTAAHIAHLMRANPTMSLDGLDLPLEFTVIASSDMTDLALFQIPEDFASLAKPLKLADTAAKEGETVVSFGFFDGGFHAVTNRLVLESLPKRMITSLEFMTTNRAGACGGPLLNAKGEVTGVHVGSADSAQLSFAVPVGEIKRLLRAYYNGGKELQPLVFNGVEIGQININEGISHVRTLEGRTVSGDFATKHKEKEVDYAHLEDLIFVSNPQKVQIVIEHTPFSPQDKEDGFRTIFLTYDLQTGTVSRQEVPAEGPFH